MQSRWNCVHQSAAYVACSQAIMGRRKRGKGYQLLVKWVGWPLDLENGWQALGSLDKCEALDRPPALPVCT